MICVKLREILRLQSYVLMSCHLLLRQFVGGNKRHWDEMHAACKAASLAEKCVTSIQHTLLANKAGSVGEKGIRLG